MSVTPARRLLLLLAALTALMLVSVSSALAAAGAQNGVGAQSPARQAGIGLTALESSCTHPGLIGSTAKITSGFCVAAEDGIGVDRGDGRDVLGRFTGVGGYGADAEAQGLEQYAADTGREVISDQVRATLPDGSIRYYDGLSPNGDGTYEGIEVKSGSAGLTEGQQAFDGAVNDGTSATATLNGQPIQITSTRNVVVP